MRKIWYFLSKITLHTLDEYIAFLIFPKNIQSVVFNNTLYILRAMDLKTGRNYHKPLHNKKAKPRYL